MPVSPTYPGVYVQEVSSGVRSIAGVSTSVGLFIGRTTKGPLNQAIRLFSYTDFERTFSSDGSVSTVPDHVRLFFLNGGTDCYVMRIANGATFAQVTLQNESSQPVLILTANYPGSVGETIRATVTYAGNNPESTFNLDLFREVVDSSGRISIVDAENFKNLSMNPNAPTYAPDVITANSALVNAEADGALPATNNGFALSGAPVLYDSSDMTTFTDQWANRIGSTQSANSFNISVDSSAFVPVSLGTIVLADVINGGTEIADLEGAIAGAINDALVSAGLTGRSVTVELAPAGETPDAGTNATLDDGTTAADAVSVLKIISDSASNDGSVLIQPANSNDLASVLRLGANQGGLEVSPFASQRPAPTDLSLEASDPTVLKQLGDLTHDDITALTLPALDETGASTTVDVPINLLADGGAVGTDPLWRNSEGGLTEVLGRIADAINTYRNANPLTFFWVASVAGYRLQLTNTRGSANSVGSMSSSPQDISGFFTSNTRNYSVGSGALAGLQTATPAVDADGAAVGLVTDGDPPQLGDYTNAFEEADRQIDLFNLMVLPADRGESPAPVPLSQVYGPASVFCQKRRAFLLMDAPADWASAQDASSNVASARIGIVKDHSAIYYPQLVIPDGRKTRTIGASGAVAGVMARTDSTRGVWKAPAGVEADIRGIVGVSQRFSDREHGVMNPRGINVVRTFPSGIVVFGARTNDGDDDAASEYKYIPIRRLALYIEESLYRGLKWVVFEPNDEPLWAQIRLNVGTFMHDLYRRGAFQGQKPSDAYFVKCDSETTTQSDRNLGMVNVMVGFAPLKPAEFVILYLQQMAGQVQI